MDNYTKPARTAIIPHVKLKLTRPGREVHFKRAVTPENLVKQREVRSADQILARLVAEAYAADHAELFGASGRDMDIMGSRPEPASSCADGATKE